MADRNKTREIRSKLHLARKALGEKQLLTFMKENLKDTITALLDGYQEFDLRLQEIERDVGLSDSFISDKDVPPRVG